MLSEYFRPLIWSWKSPVGAKLKCWALVSPSLGNLQLSVGKLQLPPDLFNPQRRWFPCFNSVIMCHEQLITKSHTLLNPFLWRCCSIVCPYSVCTLLVMMLLIKACIINCCTIVHKITSSQPCFWYHRLTISLTVQHMQLNQFKQEYRNASTLKHRRGQGVPGGG